MNPACWSWPVPPLETVAEFVARVHAENARLPRDDQRDDPEGLAELISMDGERFLRFHAERCAICGRGGLLVVDHCHATGQERGYLCRSCNVREGRSAHPVFDLYRQRHPAAILDFHAPYSGVGWTRGWSWEKHGERSRGPARPAEPWPRGG